MTCLKDSDLGCAYALMSPFAQRLEDMAARLAEGVVDLDTVLKTYGPRVSEWTFDQAQFSTRDGKPIGSLEGASFRPALSDRWDSARKIGLLTYSSMPQVSDAPGAFLI
jgi:hypothetical protein